MTPQPYRVHVALDMLGYLGPIDHSTWIAAYNHAKEYVKYGHRAYIVSPDETTIEVHRNGFTRLRLVDARS